jgi:hypothetical protein
MTPQNDAFRTKWKWKQSHGWLGYQRRMRAIGGYYLEVKQDATAAKVLMMEAGACRLQARAKEESDGEKKSASHCFGSSVPN